MSCLSSSRAAFDKNRPKVVIHNIPRSERVAQRLWAKIQGMGFTIDDLVVPKRGAKDRAIGFLYLSKDERLEEANLKINVLLFEGRELEAHTEYGERVVVERGERERVVVERQEGEGTSREFDRREQLYAQNRHKVRPMAKGFNDSDLYGEIEEPKSKRRRMESASVGENSSSMSSPASFLFKTNDKLLTLTAQAQELVHNLDQVFLQQRTLIRPIEKLEEEVEELKDWKEWTVARMKQLGSELDSLRARYGLICNRTPEELRVEIESVRFENARLVKLVSESPQELQEELAKVRAENVRLTRLFESTPDVNTLANETFDSPNLSLSYPLL